MTLYILKLSHILKVGTFFIYTCNTNLKQSEGFLVEIFFLNAQNTS